MNLYTLQAKLPNVCKWVDGIVQRHRCIARPVLSFGFTRLPEYFESATLRQACVVVLDDLPKPPLTALGLSEFEAFERLDADGITYKDVYFLKRHRAMDESLHFHELVHIVQWQLLGPERFILGYAVGLAQHGYENHPLEQIAYALEGRFVRRDGRFRTEPLVKDHLRSAMTKVPRVTSQ